jgi:CRP-like cAMP-binding protein
MYKEVMNFVLKHRAEIVLLDCEPHHLNSYLKLGFRPFTTPYTYPGIGLVIPMALIVGDYDHLKRIGSPFAMLTKPEDLAYCRFADELTHVIDNKTNVHSLTVSNTAQFLDEISSLSPGKDWSFNTTPSLFDSLEAEEIERLIQKSHIIACKKGNHIIEKDNSAKTMFILLSGHVAVEKGGQMIAMVSPGEVIGEIAFFLGVPRTASIIAATDDVKVLSLDEKGLSRLLKHEGQLANKVLMNLCRGLCSRILAGSETADFRVN